MVLPASPGNRPTLRSIQNHPGNGEALLLLVLVLVLVLEDPGKSRTKTTERTLAQESEPGV
jgi:hypothetical protein